jgi:histidine ammonia-lyase
MILQYTAAALASESRTLAHPASADSIPTSANQEDHVSMGSIAARHAMRVLEHTERIVAIEIICACQGLDLRLDRQPAVAPGTGVAEAHARVRLEIERLEQDREPGADLEAAYRLVRDGDLVDLAVAPATVGTSWLGPDPR